MKAWMIYGPGDMRLDEVPYPKLRPGWVIIKIKVVQPSITEVTAFVSGTFSGRGPLPLQLFGHEVSAEVVEVGEGVISLKKGSRVVLVDPSIGCGYCEACRTGKKYECQNRHSVGDGVNPGCFAEYAAVPADSVIEIPDNITYDEAACIQPLTACMEQIDIAQIELGDTVVVLGQGVMGLGIMQIARVSGASRIITTARRDINLELSRRFGADAAISAKDVSPVEAILELTGGRGADIVFDAAGGNPEVGLSGFETLKQALQVTRRRGKVISTANFSGVFDLESRLFRNKIFYSMIIKPSSKTVEHLVHLLSTRRIQVQPTITHRLEGIEAVAEAFNITGNKRKYNCVNPAHVIVS